MAHATAINPAHLKAIEADAAEVAVLNAAGRRTVPLSQVYNTLVANQFELSALAGEVTHAQAGRRRRVGSVWIKGDEFHADQQITLTETVRGLLADEINRYGDHVYSAVEVAAMGDFTLATLYSSTLYWYVRSQIG